MLAQTVCLLTITQPPADSRLAHAMAYLYTELEVPVSWLWTMYRTQCDSGRDNEEAFNRYNGRYWVMYAVSTLWRPLLPLLWHYYAIILYYYSYNASCVRPG